MDMNGFYISFFDLVLILLMGIAMWRGYRNGLIPEALTFAIFLLFVYLYIRITDLPGLFWNKDAARSLIYLPVVFFTLALFAVIFLSHLIERQIFKQVNKLELTTLMHFLGMGLSMIRYTFVISCVMIIFDKIDENYTWLTKIERNGSYFYKPLLRVAPTFYPYLNFDNIKNTTYIDSVKHSHLKYIGGLIPIEKSLLALQGSSDQGSIEWTSYKSETWETNNNLVIVEATINNRDATPYVTGVFKFLYNKRTHRVSIFEFYLNDIKESDMEAYKSLKRGSFATRM